MVAAYKAVGAIGGNTGTFAVGMPTHAADDIIGILLETSDQALTPPGSWAHAPGSPVSQPNGTPTRLHFWWLRATSSSETAPTVPDSGDHQIARSVSFSGCVKTGDPFETDFGASTEDTSDTSGSIAGMDTAAANSLVVSCITTGFDPGANGTAEYSAWTNSDLASITERIDNARTIGNGGTIGLATGLKAAAGTVGATTVTLANAASKAMLMVALKSAPSTNPDGPTVVDQDHPAGATTKSFTAAVGDRFVIASNSEDGSATPTITSVPIHTISAVNSAGDGTGPSAKFYEYVATTAEGITFATTTLAQNRIGVWQIRDDGGIGATAAEIGNGIVPAVDLTSVAAKSLILAHLADWNVSAENTAYLTDDYGPETDAYQTVSTSYMLQRWHQGNGDTVATTTVGFSAGTMQYALVAIEVLVAAGAVTGAAAASFGFAATAAGVDRALGTALASLGYTATASGTVGNPPVEGQAAGLFGFTGSAAGVPRTSGTANASLGFTSTATGIDRVLGAATATFGFTANAAGLPSVMGAAVAAFGFTGTASGVVGEPPVIGHAEALFGFTGVAAGVPRTAGVAASAFGFTGAAIGNPRRLGLADAIFGFSATASGYPRPLGLAVAAFGFTAIGSGARETHGAAAADLGFTATASGVAGTPPVTGAGSGLLGFTAVGQGHPRVVAAAAASFGFAGSGTGRTTVLALVSVSFGPAGSASAIRAVFGVLSGPFGFTAVALGEGYPPYISLRDPAAAARGNAASASAGNPASAQARSNTAEATT